jgi:ankyrin repeat protein
MLSPISAVVSPSLAGLLASSSAHIGLDRADSADLDHGVRQAMVRLALRDERAAGDLLAALLRNPNIRAPEWQRAVLTLLRHARDQQCNLRTLIGTFAADQLRDVARAHHRQLICFLVRSDPDAIPQRLRELRGLEATARDDLEISIRKGLGQPYVSRNGHGLMNLNEEAYNSDGICIVCQDLAWLMLRSAQQSESGRKPDWRQFDTVDAIAKAATTQAIQDARTRACHARVNTVITNAGFGEFLVTQFATLKDRIDRLPDHEARKRGVSKYFFIHTEEHAMALLTSTKLGPDGITYTVHVYDPNATQTQIRASAHDPRHFARHQLLHYLSEDVVGAPDLFEDYIAVHTPASEAVLAITEVSFDAADAGPRVFNVDSNIAPSPALIFILLQMGAEAALAQALRRAGDEGGLTFDLLAAVNRDGLSGFFMALQEGHADAARVYCNAIADAKLSPRHLAELFSARDGDGLPGLQRALQEGHAAAVDVYITAVSNVSAKLSQRQLFKLLAARSDDGMPGLFWALQLGRIDAVRAYIDGILNLSLNSDMLVELLTARADVGVPGLLMALNNRHADTVRVYIDAILKSTLSADQKVGLLDARRANGAAGVFATVRNGHADAVMAYVTAILNSALSEGDKVLLLTPSEFDAAHLAQENQALSACLDTIGRSSLSQQRKAQLTSAMSRYRVVQ